MHRLLILLALMILTPSTAFADEIADSTEGKVVKVLSGEEVVVQLDGSKKKVTVRVLGIDCTGKSRSAAAQLIGRKKVVLKSDKGFLPILQDQMGRYVAYLQTTGGDDFGLEMLKTGQCSTADWKFPHPRTQQYASASR